MLHLPNIMIVSTCRRQAQNYGTVDLLMLTLRFCWLEKLLHTSSVILIHRTFFYSEPDPPVTERGGRQLGRPAISRDGAGEAEG